MKSWMLLPFVLILGWVMGSWIPKAELRVMREELAQARMAAKHRKPGSPVALTGVTQMLGIEEGASTVPTAGRADHQATDAPVQAESPGKPALTNAASRGPVENAESSEDASDSDEERGRNMARGIEQAIELWDARVGIARSTFVSNVGLSPQETDHFDVLVDSMNMRLAHSIEEFAEQVSEGKQVGEAEGIRLMRDLTSAMAITYDEMDASMPQSWQRDAGASFSLTDFIDPAVAMPLTEIEPELGDGLFMGRR